MTNSDFRVITTGQLASVAIDPGTILIEPEGRNTAPAVQAGVPAAQNGQLVAFGIKPTRPETGYGYLELTGAPADYTTEPMALSRFVENPDAERAAKMLTTDHFL